MTQPQRSEEGIFGALAGAGRFPVDLAALLKRKRIVAYGAGMALQQTQTAMRLELDYVVDTSPEMNGRSVAGIPVYAPERLLSEPADDLLIVIYANTPQAIAGISDTLNRMGFVWGQHYIDCSLLHFESMGKTLRARLGIEPSIDRFVRARVLSMYLGIEAHSQVAGNWLVTELMEACCARAEGDIAECGVYKGGSAIISLLSCDRATRRPYHLLDSFEGFPELSAFDPAVRRSDFQDVEYAKIVAMFRNYPNVRIHRGYFDDTLPTLGVEQFSMVYADCDLYEPTLRLCEHFYRRVTAGGCMLFHDYWVPEEDLQHRPVFRGVYKAVNEFVGSNRERLVVFPETTHAVLMA